jgi:hypothetical protein
MSDITNGKVTLKKRINRVGSDPTSWRPIRPEVRGVAPARHEQLGGRVLALCRSRRMKL